MWTVLVKGRSLCKTLGQLMHKGDLNFNDQTTMNYLGKHTNNEIFDYDEVIKNSLNGLKTILNIKITILNQKS